VHCGEEAFAHQPVHEHILCFRHAYRGGAYDDDDDDDSGQNGDDGDDDNNDYDDDDNDYDYDHRDEDDDDNDDDDMYDGDSNTIHGVVLKGTPEYPQPLHHLRKA
jgi:hypothetical protein